MYVQVTLALSREATAVHQQAMQRYFQTTPPTVHQMVVTLERKGFIEREPGRARTIRVLLPVEQLPFLE